MTLTLAITTVLICAFATTARAGVPTGAQIARQIVATWTCQDQLGQKRTPARNPWNLKHHSPAFREWLLNAWKLRRADCREELAAWKRQWDWQSWLPDKWQRIGACETGYGQRPGNWRHNSGTYQGAFGFHRESWDAFKLPGYPDEAYEATPWQQYQVALAIYRRYGFSGWGCRNA